MRLSGYTWYYDNTCKRLSSKRLNTSLRCQDRPLAAAYPLPAAFAPGATLAGGSIRPRSTFHTRSSPGDAPMGGSSLSTTPPLPLGLRSAA